MWTKLELFITSNIWSNTQLALSQNFSVGTLCFPGRCLQSEAQDMFIPGTVPPLTRLPLSCYSPLDVGPTSSGCVPMLIQHSCSLLRLYLTHLNILSFGKFTDLIKMAILQRTLLRVYSRQLDIWSDRKTKRHTSCLKEPLKVVLLFIFLIRYQLPNIHIK